MKRKELKQLIEEVISEVNSTITESRKVKFILYTNPNNVTNNAYVAIGFEVKEVLSDARQYPGSYKILYQGSGTNDDLQKAKNMFSNYKFNNNETITESRKVSLNENYRDMNENLTILIYLLQSKKAYERKEAKEFITMLKDEHNISLIGNIEKDAGTIENCEDPEYINELLDEQTESWLEDGIGTKALGYD